MSTAESRAPARSGRLPVTVLGMVLFISSEVMFFGGLFSAYFTLRANAASWPPPGSPDVELLLPGLMTAVLLTSSVTQHAAAAAARRGDRAALRRWVWLTVVLGALFLGAEGWEWSRHFDEGFTAATNVYGTLYFTLTGFHGLHLLAGLAILLIALNTALASAEQHKRVGSVEAATYYWHFVDGVWIVLAGSLYLLEAGG